ncbi:MAG: helix-turn-helix transcriptional regulator [Bacteroidota bacterium]
MKCKAVVINILFFFWCLWSMGLELNAQSLDNHEPTIKGQLLLDSLWSPVVYLSHIPTFKDMYTMSNEMIIAEASVDSLGYFSFASGYLPEKEQLYRIHVSKKEAPAASLIIGGNEENHMFIIASNSSSVILQDQELEGLFGKVTLSGSIPNLAIREIDRIVTYTDSTQFNGSTMKGEFMTKAIQEKLRFVADTSSHPLVSLYALHKSKFESNYPINAKFYEDYLNKWESEESAYFTSFRTQFPKEPNHYGYYILFGLGFFILGIFMNKLLPFRRNKTTDPLKALSIQERKIFDEIRSGRSNKEISEEYSIGISTVKSHVSNIYAKLNIKSRKEAMDL